MVNSEILLQQEQKLLARKDHVRKPSHPSKEIYIVDDSPDYRYLTRKIFKDHLSQYKLQVFERGQSLYQHLMLISADNYKGSLPGLILLDLEMPGIDGYNLLKLIRQRLNCKNIGWKTLPVMILTNSATNEQVLDCYNVGATSVIIKPTDFDKQRDLFELICKYWLGHNKIF